MKKILGKKSVFISFVVAVVLFTTLYIYMLARPVAYGFSYEGISSVVKKEIECTFISPNIARLEIGDDEVELYYYQEDGKLSFIAPTDSISKKEYKERIDDDKFEDYLETADTKVNAFNAVINPRIAGVDTINVRCEDTIVFAVVGGIVELALLTFTGLSTLCFLKKKKI